MFLFALLLSFIEINSFTYGFLPCHLLSIFNSDEDIWGTSGDQLISKNEMSRDI